MRDVQEDVHAGELGGFVQCEDNLSCEGECWLYDDSIAAEESRVCGNATLRGNACARGGAYIEGDAVLEQNAIAEDCACIVAGQIGGHARVSGDATLVANRSTNKAPHITGKAWVFGVLSGDILVNGKSVIIPGSRYDNPTEVTLHIITGVVAMQHIHDVRKYELQPPKQKHEKVRQRRQKKNEPTR